MDKPRKFSDGHQEVPKTPAYSLLIERIDFAMTFKEFIYAIFNHEMKFLTGKISQLFPAELPQLFNKLSESDGKGGFYAMRLTEYSREVIFVEAITSFEYYICQFLLPFLKKQPENLSNQAISIKVSDILKANSVAEIKDLAINEFMKNLSDKGLKMILDNLKTLKSDNKPVFHSDETESLHKARLLRNLFIHNAGIINEKYIQQAARADLKSKIGKQYILEDNELYDFLVTIKTVAGRLELYTDEAQKHIMLEVLREIERTGQFPDFNE